MYWFSYIVTYWNEIDGRDKVVHGFDRADNAVDASERLEDYFGSGDIKKLEICWCGDDSSMFIVDDEETFRKMQESCFQ
jgi:hypothetical protein